MTSSVHVDNQERGILILDEGSVKGLDDTTLTAETKYPINFTTKGLDDTILIAEAKYPINFTQPG